MGVSQNTNNRITGGKMIVHIFQYKLYTKGFVDFINQVYNPKDHLFVIYGKCPNDSFKVNDYPNVRFVPSLNNMDESIRDAIRSSIKVIIHSNNIEITRLLFREPGLLKKSYIIFWGFDIYCYRSKSAGIKQFLIQALQKYQIRNVYGIGVLAQNDQQVLRDLIPGIKGRFFNAAYIQTTNYDKLYELRKKPKSKRPVKLMLGNSASETNCHFEIIDRLSKYASEDILIYCPLSYGSKEYAEKVADYGKKVFGEKFVPLTQLMPLESYWEVLSDCRIGFYNNDRQQAMGNISIMLSQGAKVYIRTDTSMWEKYQQMGYDVYDISEIGKLEWDRVQKISEESKKKNSERYDASVSLERKKKIWDVIFLDKNGEEI